MRRISFSVDLNQGFECQGKIIAEKAIQMFDVYKGQQYLSFFPIRLKLALGDLDYYKSEKERFSCVESHPDEDLKTGTNLLARKLFIFTIYSKKEGEQNIILELEEFKDPEWKPRARL